MKKLLIFLVLFGCTLVDAGAASLGLQFNDYSAQGELSLGVARDDYGASAFNLRYLYNDDEETQLGSVGFDFMGTPGNVPGLDLGVGAHVIGGEANAEDLEYVNLGVGVKLSYGPPSLGGFALAGRLVYAPKIFSWRDSERLVETGVRLSYALTPKIRALVDYQNVQVDFDERGERTIDDAFRVGFQAHF